MVFLSTRDMYVRAREITRQPERGMTLPRSSGPTFRNIGGTVSSPYSDVVAPTAGHEDSLEEAGALSNTMDPGPLEGPFREAVATTGAQRGARTVGGVTGSRFRKDSALVVSQSVILPMHLLNSTAL